MELFHQCCTVLEPDLISNSHLIGGSLAQAVEELVEHINLLLTQRIFKGDTELVELVRELSGVDLTLSVIIHRIDHLYLSFRFICKTYRPKPCFFHM